MDLPPINQLLSTLGGNAKSLPLLNEQTLQPGTSLRAFVEQSSPLTPALRQALMALLSKEATSLHTFLRKATQQQQSEPRGTQGQATNQKRTQTAVTQFQQLVKQPQLFVIQLRVLGKLLTAISPIHINKNAALNVSVRQDGQLSLNSVPNQKQPSVSASEAPKHAASDKGRQHAQHTATREITAQGLKQYLPKQEPLSQPLRQLEKLVDTLAQHKPNTFGSDLAKLVSLLQKLQQHAPTIEHIKNPQALKQTLLSSGGFLESQLRKAPKTQPQVNSTLAGTPHPTKGLDNRSANNTDAQTHLASKTSLPMKGVAPAHSHGNASTSNDFKADILRVLTAVQQLPQASMPTTGSKISAIDKLVTALLSIFPNAAPQQKQSNPLSNTIANIATPAVVAMLARITSLQLRHMLLRQQDSGVGASGGFVELPIKIGEQTLPISLHIQERFYESYPESHDPQNPQKNTSQLKKRWHVFLEFDLGEHGMFASEIKVDGDNIKSELWIEKDLLWEASRQSLSQLKNDLENHGITVEALNCHKGKAPSQDIRLQQTLVDVRT